MIQKEQSPKTKPKKERNKELTLRKILKMKKLNVLRREDFKRLKNKLSLLRKRQELLIKSVINK